MEQLQKKPQQRYIRPQGDRRFLTVLFCDLAGSTNLAVRLDPEKYQPVLLQFQDKCSEIITERYHGYIARFEGDGVMAYFGFPLAQEDAALRAVMAGLDLVEEIAELRGLETTTNGLDSKLAVRVGISSGEVLVANMGSIGRTEPNDVVGPVPNLAAHIQKSLSEPGVGISETTGQIVPGFFTTELDEPLQVHPDLDPVSVLRITGRTAAANRYEASALTQTEFVGRIEERASLQKAWNSAKQGGAQTQLICGHAGHGKTRLAYEIINTALDEGAQLVEGRCTRILSNVPYGALARLVERFARISPEMSPEEKLKLLGDSLGELSEGFDEHLPYFANMLGLPGEHQQELVQLSAQQIRERTFAALLGSIELLTKRGPLLFFIDDLQWADASTSEFIKRLSEGGAKKDLLLVLTFRTPEPEHDPDQPHEIEAYDELSATSDGVPDWATAETVSQIQVGPLSMDETRDVVRAIFGSRTVDEGTIDRLVARADGVPLYAEEVVRTYLGRIDAGKNPDDAIERIPESVDGLLRERIDGLGPSLKKIAQAAATIGRDVSYPLLTRVFEGPDAELDEGVDALVRARLLDEQFGEADRAFRFRHVLIRDVAYGSQLKAEARDLHVNIATQLIENFPSIARSQPEAVARHLTLAEKWDQAIDYWVRAATTRTLGAAHTEAISHAATGLKILQEKLSDWPFAPTYEMSLRTLRGVGIQATRGYGAEGMDQEFERAYELARSNPQFPETIPVMIGLWAYYVMRGQTQRTLDLAAQMTEIANESSGAADGEDAPPEAKVAADMQRLESYSCYGYALHTNGRIRQSRDEQQKAVDAWQRNLDAPPNPLLATDPGPSTQTLFGITQWMTGQVGKGIESVEASLKTARALKAKRVYATTYCATWSAYFHNLRGDPEAALKCAGEAYGLAVPAGLSEWEAASGMQFQIAQGSLGKTEESITNLVAIIDGWLSVNSIHVIPYMRCKLAELYYSAGEYDKGIATALEGIALGEAIDEYFYQPELKRVLGTLLFKTGSRDEGIEAVTSAIDVAESQGSIMFGLRAVDALSCMGEIVQDQARASAVKLLRYVSDDEQAPELQQVRSIVASDISR